MSPRQNQDDDYRGLELDTHEADAEPDLGYAAGGSLERSSGGGGGNTAAIIFGSLGLLLLGAAGFVAYTKLFSRPQAPPAPIVAAATPAAAATPTPPVLPPLADSDGFIRGLLAPLSPDPLFAKWLEQDGLVRRFATAADVMQGGGLPRGPLAFLASREKFAADSRGRGFVMAQRTWARYDGVANAVASLDAASCARIFGWVTPLLDEAYKQLGHPQGGVTTAVNDSLAELLEVQVPAEPVALNRVDSARGIYTFADRDLETLSAVQKALVRMGPSNAGKIQAKLSEIRPLLPAEAAPATPAASPAN